ncbi:MAG: hypothetical protein ABI670_14645 [Chloroflexota bacterium]
MSDSSKSRGFTHADIERWLEQGLIGPEQAIAIRHQAQRAESSESARQTPAGQDERQGMHMATVAYYFKDELD